jgi:hypothetical protein
MGRWSRSSKAKDREGANGAALAIALPAMSSFSYLVSITCFFADFYLSSDLSSDRSTRMSVRGPPRRGITEGSRLAHCASRSPKATKSARMFGR